jgi:hypothetical protein
MSRDDSRPVALIETSTHKPHNDVPRGRSPAVRELAHLDAVGTARRTSASFTSSVSGTERGFRSTPTRPLGASDQPRGPGTTTPDRTQEERSVISFPVERGQSPITETPPSEHGAWLLKETFGALFLSGSLGASSKTFGLKAFKLYRDRLLEEAGNPSDPIEIMLVEQLALSHLSVGRLPSEAASASNPENAIIYGSLAIGLTAEFRRTALAFEGLSHPRRGSSGQQQRGAVDSASRSWCVAWITWKKKASTPRWKVNSRARSCPKDHL